MIRLSPSVLAADFTRLGQQVSEVEKAGVTYLHLDVMDGFFVPSISFGMPLIASLRPVTKLVFDVHLMIMEPERYVDEFVHSGADIITFHLEACAEPPVLIDKLHRSGVKAGLAIKPDTPAKAVLPYLKSLEMVLVMSVYPGFGGQQFIPEALEQIKVIKEYLTEHHLAVDIQVDGGIYQDNVRQVVMAGANVIVAGTAIFKGDIKHNIEGFQTVFANFG